MTYINNTTVPTDGLVASYDLDGSADDSSGNGNNGTATNITWVGADRGYVEEVASFNGSNSGINGFTTNLSNFSISATFNADNTTNSRIFGRGTFGNDIGIQILNGQIRGLIGQDGSGLFLGMFYTINTNETYNYVITYDGANLIQYINGVEVTNDVTSTTLGTGNISSSIGYNENENFYYFDGKIGLVKLYDKAISQEEIDALHQEGLRKLGPTNSPLSGNFPKYSLPNLEEGKVLEISRPQNGGIYYDQTGNGNNGMETNVVDSTNGLNNVMSFNGSSSFVSTTFSPSNLQNGFTAELYLNPNDINSTQIAFQQFSGSGAFWDYLINAGSFTLRTFQTSNGDIVAPIETGKWQQFIFTINGTELKLYKDGVLIGTTTTNLQNPTGSVEIGRNVFGGGGNYFNGQISNPRICNRALSETEIKEQYYSNKII